MVLVGMSYVLPLSGPVLNVMRFTMPPMLFRLLGVRHLPLWSGCTDRDLRPRYCGRVRGGGSVYVASGVQVRNCLARSLARPSRWLLARRSSTVRCVLSRSFSVRHASAGTAWNGSGHAWLVDDPDNAVVYPCTALVPCCPVCCRTDRRAPISSCQ